MKILPCHRCMVPVQAGPRASKTYCADCRVVVRREQGAAYDRRRRPATVLGSTRQCADCGATFVVASGLQTVCGNCVAGLNARRGAAWAKANPERIRASAKKYNDRKRATVRGSLEWAMRVGIRRGLRSGSVDGRRTFGLLGYDVDELRVHLERQFTDGMSWENYGPYWHIDHRVPLSFFNYDTPDCPDFRSAWALTNLQPLRAEVNLSKGGRRTLLV